jgi:hypothetical protein
MKSGSYGSEYVERTQRVTMEYSTNAGQAMPIERVRGGVHGQATRFDLSVRD